MLAEENIQTDAGGAFERAVLAPLAKLPAPNGGTRCVLGDALDEALSLKAGQTIVTLLASKLNRLPEWLRIVATTRKDPDVLTKLSGLRAKALCPSGERAKL